MAISTKHARTLADIFTNPVRADIRWIDVENLFRALGAEITQGSGSRVRISLNGRRMIFHEPHPQPTIVKDAVRSVRRFLLEAGVSP
ncbi:MAG: type II toxin-antitoxin system HicA family toxin [Paracoccaceae bacterium]